MLCDPLTAMPPSNPFATRFVRPGRIDYRFRDGDSAAEANWQQRKLVNALMQNRFGCIVGPHGTGKSTLIHSLRPLLATRFRQIEMVALAAAESHWGFVDRWRQARDQSRIVQAGHKRLNRDGLLVVDGLEQLNTVDIVRLQCWLRVKGQYLLATTHRPLRGLYVLHQTCVERERVTSLTRGLVADQPDEIQQFVIDNLARQDWTKLTSVRDYWFDLYDKIEDMRKQVTLS